VDPAVIGAVIAGAAAIVAAVIQGWRRRPKIRPPTLKSSVENATGVQPARSKTLSSSQLSSVDSYDSRDAVYSAIVQAVRTVELDAACPKTIFVGALHGHSGKRRLSRFSSNPVFAAFDQEMLRCVKSSGPGMWRVRELYNITTKDRLDEIVGWLQQTESEDGYEVRAYCEPSSIGHLAPLVIGNQHAFLALEDDRYFRVTAGLDLHDPAAVAFVQRYCDMLWGDSRVFILRTGYGVDNAQISALHHRIERLTSDTSIDTDAESGHRSPA
jgi:hypothetical protein